MDDLSGLAPLLAALEERRLDLDKSRQELLKRETALKHFYDRLQQKSECFDAEDLECVEKALDTERARIARVDGALSTLTDDLMQKTTLFSQMLTTIHSRGRILEEDERIFAEHDDLLRFFASKQLRLKRLLEEKMSALVSSMPEAHSF